MYCPILRFAADDLKTPRYVYGPDAPYNGAGFKGAHNLIPNRTVLAAQDHKPITCETHREVALLDTKWSTCAHTTMITK